MSTAQYHAFQHYIIENLLFHEWNVQIIIFWQCKMKPITPGMEMFSLSRTLYWHTNSPLPKAHTLDPSQPYIACWSLPCPSHMPGWTFPSKLHHTLSWSLSFHPHHVCWAKPFTLFICHTNTELTPCVHIGIDKICWGIDGPGYSKPSMGEEEVAQYVAILIFPLLHWSMPDFISQTYCSCSSLPNSLHGGEW